MFLDNRPSPAFNSFNRFWRSVNFLKRQQIELVWFSDLYIFICHVEIVLEHRT